MFGSHNSSRSRSRQGAALVVVATLLATACGDGDDGSSGASATTAAPVTTVATTTPAAPETTDATTTPPPDQLAAGTFEVEHVAGLTEVPADPQHLLALDEVAAYLLLDVGVAPDEIYLSFLTVSTPVVAEELGIPTQDHNIASPSFEAAAASGTDLIIGSDHPASLGNYELWSDVAPTVLFGNDATIEEQLEVVARAAGRQDAAVDRIAALQAKVGRLADRIATTFDQPPSVSVIGSLGGMLFAPPSDIGALPLILADLGLARPTAQQVEVDPGFPFVFFSEEELLSHDADVVLTLGGGIYEDVTGLGLFPSLTGDTAVVEGELWLSTHPFGVDWVLADLEAVLFAEGEVATLEDTSQRWADYAAGLP